MDEVHKVVVGYQLGVAGGGPIIGSMGGRVAFMTVIYTITTDALSHLLR